VTGRADPPSAPAPAGGRRLAVLVVGATSAVAERLADLYAAEGARLILAAREPDALHAVAQDLRVRRGAEVEELVFDACQRSTVEVLAARLRQGAAPDVVVFALGANGRPDAADHIGEIERVTAANYGAIAHLGAALLPGLRAHPGASVAFLSSVAGDRGRKTNFVYGAAKAALNAYAQGLRGLLWPGVAVTTVKLGYVDSRMSYGLAPPWATLDPADAARAIHRAIRRRRDVVYVPGWWRWIMLALRAIPEAIFKRLTIP